MNETSSSRVRWGIAWTYERTVGRCSSCLVKGGLQVFEISISLDDGLESVEDSMANKATTEVVSRLVDYFEKLRDYPLKCSTQMRECNEATIRQGKPAVCVTAIEERFFGCNASELPVLNHEHDNINLPYEGHFVLDAFVECIGRCDDANDGTVKVQVTLEMYSHTKRGNEIISKIRGPMLGEIGRTNRRWRRLLKRQEQAV